VQRNDRPFERVLIAIGCVKSDKAYNAIDGKPFEIECWQLK
jgi:hypothetical protein